MKSIFLILRESDVTNELINLSTSRNIGEAPRLPNGRVILEFDEQKSERILSYKWYTREEVINLQQRESTWLDWFFGLFS